VRKCGYINSVKPAKWPHRIACCTVSATPVKIGAAGQYRTLRLDRWRIDVINIVSEQVDGRITLDGSTVHSFLDALCCPEIGIKGIDIYFVGAMQCLNCLGLWQTSVMRGISVCITSDPPTILTFPGGYRGSNIRILDIGNHHVDGWNEICKDLFLQSGGGEMHGQGGPVYPDELDAAHYRFSLFIKLWLDRLLKLGFGPPQPTAGAQAYRLFRERYINSVIAVHDNTAALRLERESSYGGRCEAFKLGKYTVPTFEYDANSHYLAVTMDEYFPARLRGTGEGSPKDLQSLVESGYCCIADVTLQTNDNVYPCRRPFGTIYPVGRWRTTLCANELSLALDRDEVISVHCAAWYDPELLFGQWAADMFKTIRGLADAGDSVSSKMVKRLAVSLFGKFGQHATRWRNHSNAAMPSDYATWYAPHPRYIMPGNVPGEPPKEPWECELQPDWTYTQWRSICGTVQYETRVSEGCNSCPGIAAFVYSYGRSKLLSWLMEVGTDHALYCDTDSLIVTAQGKSVLEQLRGAIGAGLGQLKQKRVNSSIEIFGVKQYKTDTAKVLSGVPASAEILADGKVQYWIREGFNAALHRLSPPSELQTLVKHRLANNYKHGVVGVDGRIKPIRLMESYNG
jgi:DNA polymerase type B, organellar and viral